MDDATRKSYMINPLVHGDAQQQTATGGVVWPLYPLVESKLTQAASTISFLECYWAEGYDGSSGAVPYPVTRNNNGPIFSPINAASSPTQVQLGATNIAYKRHLEGANYLFCDGHVKWQKWDKMVSSPYPFDPTQ